jgi:hypothetical protein
MLWCLDRRALQGQYRSNAEPDSPDAQGRSGLVGTVGGFSVLERPPSRALPPSRGADICAGL